MRLLKKLLVFAVLVCTASSYGQLVNFILQVEKTDQTCLGNGSLTFLTTNIAPGASMLYKVYMLPNTTVPVAMTTANYVGSLMSGQYKVVAIQVLNDQSNTQETLIAIEDSTVPLDFDISINNQYCATGGNLIVNVTSGEAMEYEIIDGPELRPLQNSNVFEGLTYGTYKIRVFNSCGVAKVKAYTVYVNANMLTIGDSYYSNTIASCDSIVINNLITPDFGFISYPVSVQYRLNAIDMDGESIVINQNYLSGDSDTLLISAVVPRYFNESYAYDIIVNDNCTITYEKLDNVMDPLVEVSLNKELILCAEGYLKISVYKHTSPFTVEFLEAPEGFTAAAYNTVDSGLFYGETITFGSPDQAVPYGNYVVKITDACGRIAQDSLQFQYEPLHPHVVGEKDGCFSLFGKIYISIDGQEIETATILEAPVAFTNSFTLPHIMDINFSSAGTAVLSGLPVGIYRISFTDNCGFSYIADAEIPPYIDTGLVIFNLPDCTADYGSIKLKKPNANLVFASIIAAPSTLGETLPFDVSAAIANTDGDLYLNSLPQGTYTFKTIDACGVEKFVTKDVRGYSVSGNNVVLFVPSCGSFSVKVLDSDNSTWGGGGYWLQKFDTVSGTWGHPNGTNFGFIEGTEPTEQYGTRLINSIPLDNVTYTGQFRIIKYFESYGYGIPQKTLCLKVLHEFEFNDTLSISNAYTLECTGHPNDIYIDATGYGLTYRIEKKNDAPYVVDNGANNIFINLELSASYVFSIEDQCGNKLTKEINMRELPSIADPATPGDIIVCEETAGPITSYQFLLKGQDTAILGDLPAALYTVTYHLTQNDADSGVHSLPEYYTATHNGQIIYARLVHNEIGLCYGITSFKLFITGKPDIQITSTGTLCNGEGTYLTAPHGFNTYLWSTGETTQTIHVTESGLYSVIVQHSIESRPCDGYGEIAVTESAAPELVKVETNDWMDDYNMITVIANGMDNLLYSIDGQNWQEYNVFTTLENGLYTVFVKDAGGCGMESQEVTLLNYPKFFTPNGDGYHDRWRIKFSMYEPNLRVTIFDRFGKVISSLGPSDEGWDGTFNGMQLPSTDYWFVVKREDGRELKGHFAMLR